MRRGRPPYPDVLTPREWEVLALVREGLTNEQIALRLGISENGVKYHVREILSKLGVSRREEAAAWQPETAGRRSVAFGSLLAPLKLAVSSTAAKVAGGVVIAGAGVVLVLLALGLLTMGERQPEPRLRFLYSTQVDAVNSGSRLWPTRAVVAYDPASGEKETLLEYGGVGEYAVTEVASTTHLYYATEYRVVQAKIDGSDARDIFGLPTDDETVFVNDIDVSPDGTKLAIIAGGTVIGNQGAVIFLDTATGNEISRVEANRPEFEAFRSYIWQVEWRDDNLGVLVSGGTGSERPGDKAMVWLDGRVEIPETEGFVQVAAGGRLIADGPGVICDGMLISGHRLAIRDLDAGGAVIAAVEDPTKAFTGWAWSPNRDELLYQERDWQEGPICSPEVRWGVLSITAGPRPVPDLDALLTGWYGDRLVELECDFGPEYATYLASAGATARVALPDRGSNMRQQCFSTDTTGELRLGGKPIDRVPDVYVLGFYQF